MKRFKVICIGYKEPSKEKIKDLLKFEENYLGNKRKVCIHPGVCITETENYNKSVLDELETQGYEEYNLDDYDSLEELNKECGTNFKEEDFIDRVASVGGFEDFDTFDDSDRLGNVYFDL